MKKSLWIFALIVVLFAAFSVTAIYAASASPAVVVSAPNGEKVYLTATENTFYLPASVDVTKVLIL